MFRRVFTYVAVLALLLVAPHVVQGQQTTGTVTGVVRDSSGGAIPGATVQLRVEGSNTPREATTDAQGVFEISGLAAGQYEVSAALDGFDTSTVRVSVIAGQSIPADVTLSPARFSQSVVVTARRTEEVAQDVPIPVSVVRGDLVADAGAFNVNRLREMLPTVQFYSSNPRNTAINIRGLGAPFGLTNDGLEQGVGMYIDGVYFARPASATLDFLDVEQVEVVRGPQGTLFGKNTTAGAINITTKKPSFTPASEVELNYGNIGYVQAKASITGPVVKNVAGRLSLSGTQRDGVLENVRTGDDVNDLNNLGMRGQLLFAQSDAFAVTLAIDHTRQRPRGYTQVLAGVAPTLRAANRQWPAIAADLNYTAPSYNPYDRVTDIDTPMRSFQRLGGTSVNIDRKVGRGRLTSTTAYRYWDWKPSNDRDFVGLPITTISSGTSYQSQWTQELRYAGDIHPRVNLVAGFFYFRQLLDSDPVIVQEQGAAAYRVLLAPSANASTPGLLDGYGYRQYVHYRNSSSAVFSQAQLKLSNQWRVLPGIRVNYDQKKVNFDQQTYGGLQTTNAALITLQQSVLAPQKYDADTSNTNNSGQVTVAYKPTAAVNAYATFAKTFKSIGLNLNGVPADAQNQPILSAATVKPEDVKHYEFGIKTSPFRNVTANVTFFNSDIRNFQAQVFNGAVGVLRGYLANAERVRVRGAEFDGSFSATRNLSFYASAAITSGKYLSFKDAPLPVEETGAATQFKDISGSDLPGLSKYAVSFGGELVRTGAFFGRTGQFFGAFDASHRSRFSSSATPSAYLNVNEYSLLNTRVGFRTSNAWTLSVWARNLLNKNYLDLMSAVAGNTGLLVAQPGDPRTFGVTLRLSLK
ncbi:MAG: TonB-dependent receptor [Vicinamibacterales bacterium]